MAWKAYIDGGSRGNPGPAAAGVVLRNEAGQIVFAGGLLLGRMTNNQAEYRGLLHALDLLHRAGAGDVAVFSDSELLVRQMNGHYKVRSPELQPLYEKARRQARSFTDFEISHVRREANTQADALVNRALDSGHHVFLTDTHGLSGEIPPSGVPGRSQGGRSAETLLSAEAEVAGARAIRVSVIKGPQSGGCPAGTRKGQTYVFTAVTPELCVNACAAVVEAVLALQATAPEDLNGAPPLTPQCGRPGCGAVFEVRLAEGL